MIKLVALSLVLFVSLLANAQDAAPPKKELTSTDKGLTLEVHRDITYKFNRNFGKGIENFGIHCSYPFPAQIMAALYLISAQTYRHVESDASLKSILNAVM